MSSYSSCINLPGFHLKGTGGTLLSSLYIPQNNYSKRSERVWWAMSPDSLFNYIVYLVITPYTQYFLSLSHFHVIALIFHHCMCKCCLVMIHPASVLQLHGVTRMMVGVHTVICLKEPSEAHF